MLHSFVDNGLRRKGLLIDFDHAYIFEADNAESNTKVSDD